VEKKTHNVKVKLSQVCILDGKLYADLELGSETDAQLDACTLLTNSSGKELLAPNKGAVYGEDRRVVMPLRDGKVCRSCG